MLSKQVRVIGIVGGVGPMAGVYLHKAIIKNTKINGNDQDHLDVYHLSNSNQITDRTNYLLNKNCENPSIGALKTTQALWFASKACNKKLVVGVPCNTFHSPKIWDTYLKKANIMFGDDVKIIDMLKETVNDIKLEYSDKKNIGILCTNGTRETKLYDNILLKNNLNPINVSDKLQKNVNECIYNLEWGIKANSSNIKKNVYDILDIAINYLINKKAQIIILGCSELPLVYNTNYYKKTDIPLFNPVNSLANALIKTSKIS